MLCWALLFMGPLWVQEDVVLTTRASQTHILKGGACGCSQCWECAPTLVEECEILPSPS